MKPVRVWEQEGRITAGPYRVGQRVACVLNHRQLVWINPGKDGEVWKYNTPGEGIVGQPQRGGDVVVVAGRKGLLIGLDPQTGKPTGKGAYKLRANVAPAANPVAFGPNQLFAPLTDGTVLVLPLKELGQAAQKAKQ